MTPLWTSTDAAAAAGGKASSVFSFTGIAIDSRAARPGDLFIALVGPIHDAHAFVSEAFKIGAAGALVHRPPEGVDPARLITVADTFSALQSLGKAGRSRFAGQVVAITGSVGKTSTKDMLAAALSPFGPTHAAVGSFNNHWGVPLTLARAPRDASYAVVEMGMNHEGELRDLTRMTRPHGAVVTWIAPAHLEFFGSTAHIAAAKAEIFEGVESGGFAVLPKDSEHFSLLADHARRRKLRILAFGSDRSADIRLLSHSVQAGQTTVAAMADRHALTYRVGGAGRHWAMNSLAVLAAAKALGLDLESVVPSLATLEPAEGRGRRHAVSLDGGAFTLVDESYNANPASVDAALTALGLDVPSLQGRRIAVLGDMLELGSQSAALHAALAQTAVENHIDAVYTCGSLMAHLAAALPRRLAAAHAADSAALAPIVAGAVQPGDLVMVKGSSGSAMKRIVKTLLAMECGCPRTETSPKRCPKRCPKR